MSSCSIALLVTAAILCGCSSSPADGRPGVLGPVDVGVGAQIDSGSTPPLDVSVDVGVTPPTDLGRASDSPDAADAPDVPPVECRIPIPNTSCNGQVQEAPEVVEMQIATAPPKTTAGFYPAGVYHLTSSRVYTGPGGASGPSGLRYAATMEVHGMGSIDYFAFVQRQTGCAPSMFRFTGDTFGTSSTLVSVSWTCPTTCATCGTTMPYTGTLTSFLVQFPISGGRTLEQEFTYRRN